MTPPLVLQINQSIISLNMYNFIGLPLRSAKYLFKKVAILQMTRFLQTYYQSRNLPTLHVWKYTSLVNTLFHMEYQCDNNQITTVECYDGTVLFIVD